MDIGARIKHLRQINGLEQADLAEQDRRLLQQREFRETVAAAVVAGLRTYFGEPEQPAR